MKKYLINKYMQLFLYEGVYFSISVPVLLLSSSSSAFFKYIKILFRNIVRQDDTPVLM